MTGRRSMRFVPFRRRDDGALMFTLVMEWKSPTGDVVQDERYQMTEAEFDRLLESANEARSMRT